MRRRVAHAQSSGIGQCATMCNMKTKRNARASDRVGVREIRQNLSVYLRRVKAGESLIVTERGHTVARLTPMRESQLELDRLVAEGLATPATRNMRDLGPPLRRMRGGRPLSWILEEMRSEEE